MIAAIGTLFVGGLIGYMGQRSRFCIISGIRDCFMVRNFHRIKGLLALVISATVTFAVLKLTGERVPNFPMLEGIKFTGYLIASIVGGMGIGFFSVMAEGCPFRQHVMAAEGSRSALFYLLGFYLGIIYFNLVTVRFLELIINVV